MLVSRFNIIFKHGDALTHKLFDLIDIKRADGVEDPARSFKVYSVTNAKWRKTGD